MEITTEQQVENCANYLAKGRQCAVHGRINTSNYTDAEGKKHYNTDVIADKVEVREMKKDIEKAIQTLRHNGFIENSTVMKHTEAVDTAIEALEKQIPKKVLTKQFDGLVGFCPSCKVTVENGMEKFNYCPNCGQKLEWSNKDKLLFNSAAGGGKTKTMLSEAMGLQGKFNLRKDLGGTNE